MTEIKKGDIIWAKLRGYPWWPAYFIETKRHKPELFAKVRFIGDNSRAVVAISQMVAYKDKREEYAHTKRKDLLKSIKIADLLISKGSKIRLDDQGSPTTSKVEEKEFNGKRKIIISDDEGEPTSRDTTEKKIAYIEEAKNLITKYIKEENVKLTILENKELINAIRTIKKEIKHIHTKDIKEDLIKFKSIYCNELSLKNAINEIDEILKLPDDNEKGIAISKNRSVTSSKECPQRFKRLKRFEYEVKEDIDDSIEYDNIKEYDEKIAQDVKDFKLMVIVCQETAKLLEEVLFHNYIIENKSK